MAVPSNFTRVTLAVIFLVGGVALIVGDGAPTAAAASSSPTGLFSVSCTSPTACFAVGYSFNGVSSTSVPLAERWNGTTWTIQATPNPISSTAVELYGVSCTSSSACTAVGYYSTAVGGLPSRSLAERWNGRIWTIQSTPKPVGATDVELTGVSCTSPVACTAVGYSFANTKSSLLAEKWNGAAWTIQSTPKPAGSTDLASVSCTSPSACMAVGYSGSAGLAEKWNGTNWTIEATPKPVGASSSSLSVVSCTLPTACIAVGSSYKSGTTSLLAERWNGTMWTLQSTPPVPLGTSYATLAGLSCSGPTACTAVGYNSTSMTTTLSLAERWNGTKWTIQSTPNPVDQLRVGLDGVSCTSPTACTAVGGTGSSVTMSRSVAERWNGTKWTIQSSP